MREQILDFSKKTIEFDSSKDFNINSSQTYARKMNNAKHFHKRRQIAVMHEHLLNGPVSQIVYPPVAKPETLQPIQNTSKV